MKPALIILFALLVAGCTETVQQIDASNPLIDSLSVVRCIYVVDGDTWRFRLKNDTFSVRVLGLDCFETKHNDRLLEQADRKGISEDSAYALGIKAKELAQTMLIGKDISIVRDFGEENFDVYNRILRHCIINGLNWADYLKQQGLDSQ